MQKILSAFFMIVLSVMLASCTADRRDVGMVAGGVVGGVAGSALTNGSTAGTVVGAVGGGLVGRELAR